MQLKGVRKDIPEWKPKQAVEHEGYFKLLRVPHNNLQKSKLLSRCCKSMSLCMIPLIIHSLRFPWRQGPKAILSDSNLAQPCAEAT
jgi:hypothetical protein